MNPDPESDSEASEPDDPDDPVIPSPEMDDVKGEGVVLPWIPLQRCGGVPWLWFWYRRPLA